MVRTFHEQPHVGNWLPLTAFQLDHIMPWEAIKSSLWSIAKWADDKDEKILSWRKGITSANRGVKPGDLFREHVDNGWNPTVFAARMYYHNEENLQPMEGSLNAAKGARKAPTTNDYASNVKTAGEAQLDLENRLTRSYLTLLGQIQDVGHYRQGSSDSRMPKMWKKLITLLDEMEKKAEEVELMREQVRLGSTLATPERKMRLDHPIGTPGTPAGVREASSSYSPRHLPTDVTDEDHDLNTAFREDSGSELGESEEPESASD